MSKENEVCSCGVIHQDVVDKAKKKLPLEETLDKATIFFKVFADRTRLKILSLLLEEEMCVCDIATALQMSHSSISHQLRVLRQARVVKNRKDGKVVYYSLDDDHVRNILSQGLVHAEH